MDQSRFNPEESLRNFRNYTRSLIQGIDETTTLILSDPNILDNLGVPLVYFDTIQWMFEEYRKMVLDFERSVIQAQSESTSDGDGDGRDSLGGYLFPEDAVDILTGRMRYSCLRWIGYFCRYVPEFANVCDAVEGFYEALRSASNISPLNEAKWEDIQRGLKDLIEVFHTWLAKMYQ